VTDVVIFDLDGTLVDSPRAIVEAFTAAFASMGVPVPAAAAIRATIGLPLERAFSSLLGVPPTDGRVALGAQRYVELFRELILPRAAELVFPGVAAGLATLRAHGRTLAVATSKYYASADALLTAAGLREHITVLVGADQVANPKPHPDSALLVLERLDVPAGRAVVVGDTTHDVLMAAAAGTRSVAVTYGVHSARELRSTGPTWLADSFEDVVALLLASGSAATVPGNLHQAGGL
jgi:phosphoglycolate phosphatase